VTSVFAYSRRYIADLSVQDYIQLIGFVRRDKCPAVDMCVARVIGYDSMV